MGEHQARRCSETERSARGSEGAGADLPARTEQILSETRVDITVLGGKIVYGKA